MLCCVMGVYFVGVLLNGNVLFFLSVDVCVFYVCKIVGLGVFVVLDDVFLFFVFDCFMYDDDGVKMFVVFVLMSKVCCVFVMYEDFWKSLMLNVYGGKFMF